MKKKALQVRSVVVKERRWRTIHDGARHWRRAYQAIITFGDGTRVSTVRLSRAVAQHLLRSGARRQR
jgi:hypothetical protein